MKKIDLKKEFRDLYGTTRKQGFVVVDVPQMSFLMVDGEGDPNTSEAFSNAIEALYSLSYPLKFMIKKSSLAIDCGVMPLEALWWAEHMADFSPEHKDIWQWTVMIMQPEWITPELFAEAREATAKKKDLPALSKVRLEAFAEGHSAQCLYVGPFADQGPTIAGLHQFIADSGYQKCGKHHEIYLSDMRRTDPSKLKTILRQPMASA